MRVIGPGKRNSGAPSGRGQVDDGKEKKASRTVWDDFDGQRKKKGKQVFLKDKDNRLIAENSSGKIRGSSGGGLSFGPSEAREFREYVAGDVVEEGSSERSRADYEVIEERLGYQFNDRELLSRALTHRSALHQKERTDYERLEFLGDAVLSLSVAHLASDYYPDANEGTLSKMRAALVNTQALAAIARNLEFGPYIRLGRGESSSGGRDRPSILADVAEAVFGAIYRDGGFESAFQVVARVFGEQVEVVNCSDPKTDLQEKLHLEGSDAPSYLVERVEGPVHAPTFVTVVIVDSEVAGRGKGNTKKAAHQAAATEVLARLVPSYPALDLREDQDYIIPSLTMTVSELEKPK